MRAGNCLPITETGTFQTPSDSHGSESLEPLGEIDYGNFCNQGQNDRYLAMDRGGDLMQV